MVDLTTTYLGLNLKNPVVPSSSPLTGHFDDARRLEDAGASALILPSIFEEELIREQEKMDRFVVMQDIGHHEADSFLPTAHNFESKLDQILEKIARYKSALSIPVVASLNGITDSGWVDHAKDLEEAGCDAIELNLYGMNAEPGARSEAIEERYHHIVQRLVESVQIPCTVKLSNQFTGLMHFVTELEISGAAGVSLFNRFYQPDIDLETLQIKPQLNLSSWQETLLRIRWLALLRPQVKFTLAATGGFHGFQDVLKALLAGADVVHLCSVLLKGGPGVIQDILGGMSHWMEDKEYESVQQLKGSLSHQNAVNPAGYERENYMEVLDSYSYSPGVRV